MVAVLQAGKRTVAKSCNRRQKVRKVLVADRKTGSAVERRCFAQAAKDGIAVLAAQCENKFPDPEALQMQGLAFKLFCRKRSHNAIGLQHDKILTVNCCRSVTKLTGSQKVMRRYSDLDPSLKLSSYAAARAFHCHSIAKRFSMPFKRSWWTPRWGTRTGSAGFVFDGRVVGVWAEAALACLGPSIFAGFLEGRHW
jgi:hypothetical protein